MPMQSTTRAMNKNIAAKQVTNRIVVKNVHVIQFLANELAAKNACAKLDQNHLAVNQLKSVEQTLRANRSVKFVNSVQAGARLKSAVMFNVVTIRDLVKNVHIKTFAKIVLWNAADTKQLQRLVIVQTQLQLIRHQSTLFQSIQFR